MMDFAGFIAKDLGLTVDQVKNVISLFEEGATIPFIARYRKERTGGMDEVALRSVFLKNEELTELDKRKKYIISVIEENGRLTPDLKKEIEECYDKVRLEDIYLPYRPKKATRAQTARNRGLEPLAKIIMSQRCSDLSQIARRFLKGEVLSEKEALEGASDIIAEWIAENPHNRNRIRNSISRHGRLTAKGAASGTKYADYEGYSSPLSRVQPHAFLALQRAESQKILRLSVESDDTCDINSLLRNTLTRGCSQDCAEIIEDAVIDSYKRLLKPSVISELMKELKEKSDRESIALFSEALRQVLLSAPVSGYSVMAIDPGFRTGCKVVCIDRNGKLIDHDVIYPHQGMSKLTESADIIRKLLKRHEIGIIALGDGTASRETEQFLRNHVNLGEIKIERVSEQGASIYSASETARKEFPDLDLTFRSAVSIGRRLQDPLAELVKIDPKSIGVGQYQHDVNQVLLKETLDFTVERCVNEVGVNLNTASPDLLAYVSGIGKSLSEKIVAYREEHGKFLSRKDLLKVPRFGAKAFEQASGFLRVPESSNPLDNSAVHPESYSVVEKMASAARIPIKDLLGNEAKISEINPGDFVNGETGLETVKDILEELLKPGRDPRQASEADWRDLTINSTDDIREGMILNGKIVNLTAFGAFVDLGIKTNGLIHISKISHKRISTPADVLRMWQIVKVRVIGIDRERDRISLSMIDL